MAIVDYALVYDAMVMGSALGGCVLIFVDLLLSKDRRPE